MQELIQVAFAPINLFYTILFLFVILYWLSVILGAIDMSAFDFDVEVDADLDIDVDLDADVDTEVSGTSASWLAAILHFFNFGKLPFMIVITAVTIVGWPLSILSNYYLGGNSWGFALALFIPILFISLLVAKILTSPLVPVFERLDSAANEIDYIGKVCKLRLPASHTKFGQAEVMVNDVSLLINVKTKDDQSTLSRGEEALIIGKTPDEKYYLIQKLS
ncbi:MAG: hypothetical protein AAFO07_13520 [Bacteroidota bacterium]